MAKGHVRTESGERRRLRLPVLGEAAVCQRCSERGRTCCEPVDGVALAPLTPGDTRRIADATGLDTETFSTSRRLDREEIEALEAEDPVLRGLVGSDGLIRSLARTGEACVFWRRGKGCSLSYEVRPLLCRRFPIVRRGSALSVRPGGDCLAIEEAADMPSLLITLGITEGELSRIDRQIRTDLGSR
jgi:Fe-S-cluster containining protein